MAIKIKFIFILSLSIFTYSIFGAEYDPELNWQTIETNHFIIHYPEKERKFAAKMATISEDVHEKLVPFMKWEPEEKTHIVLIDNTDQTNGYSTPFPQDHIVIYLIPPPPDSILNNYDDWLRIVFTHEYTHTLHLDQNGGLFTVFRQFFGKYFVKNNIKFTSYPVLLFPSWIHESIAVYNETKFTGKGRGNSSYSDLIIDTSVLEDNFPDLSQLIIPTPHWPSGLLPYIYGEKFLNYLIKTYGENYIYKTFKLERNLIFPLWLEITSLLSSHSIMESDWYNWQKSLKKKLKKEEVKLNRWNYKWESEPLFNKPSPVVTDNKLYFIDDNGREYTSLIEKDIGSGKTKRLSKGSILPYLSINPAKNKLLYAKINFYHNYYYFSDLFLYDKKSDREIRITKGKRLTYPTFAEKNIWAVQNRLSGVSLCEIKFSGNKYTIVKTVPLPPEIKYAAFLKFDKNNNRLLFSVNKNGNIDIASYSLSTGKIDYLTDDKFLELYPYPASDGIIFTSDRNGKGFNLYKLKNNNIYILTKGFNGFFNFSFSDNRIFAGYYTSKGFRVVQIPFDELEFKKIGINKNKKETTYDTNEYTLKYRPHKYDLIKNINISEITPAIMWNQYYWQSQISITGGDVLYFLNYQLLLSYNNLNNDIDISASVVYDKYNPSISISGGSFTKFYTQKDLTTNQTNIFPQKSKFLSVNLYHATFGENNFSKYLILSYNFSKITTFDKNFNRDFQYNGNVYLSLLYNTAGYFALSRGLNDGYFAGITFLMYNPLFGSTFNTNGIVFDFKKAFPFLKGSILGEIYGGAVGTLGENAKMIELGENTSLSDINGLSIPTENSFNFMGYPLGQIKTNSALVTSLDFRYPLITINRGIGTIPIWLGETWINLFSQNAIYSKNKLDFSKYNGNIGAALNINTVILNFLPLNYHFYIILDFPGNILYYYSTINFQLF